jgi:hypothetical protein
MKLLGNVAPELGSDHVRHGWPRTDGSRWAAYEPVVGTTRVIHTRTGRSFERSDCGRARRVDFLKKSDIIDMKRLGRIGRGWGLRQQLLPEVQMST